MPGKGNCNRKSNKLATDCVMSKQRTCADKVNETLETDCLKSKSVDVIKGQPVNNVYVADQQNKQVENPSQNGNNSIALMSTNVQSESHDSNKTNLLINFLPSSMTEKDLRQLFSQQGEIASCKLVIKDNRSLCYGFVNYKSHVDAINAIETRNGLKIENKVIKVSFARPSSEAITGANLFIKGLPANTTLDDLKNLFSPYGNIIDARLLRRKNPTELGSNSTVLRYPPGNCPVYTSCSGFVRFDRRSEAARAIDQLNNTSPAGFTEVLTVKFANSRCKNSYVIPPRLAKLPKCNKQLAIYNNKMTKTYRLPYEAFNYPLLYPHHGWCIFVFNLFVGVQEIDLWQLFGPFGAVQTVRIIRHPTTKQTKGYGFVNMPDFYEAAYAIETLDGYNFCGRLLHVSFKK